MSYNHNNVKSQSKCNCACKGEPGPRGAQGAAGPMGPIDPSTQEQLDSLELVVDGLVDNNLYVAELNLTSAQILNSYSSPIEIVPAPPAGSYIELITGSATLTYLGIPYGTNLNFILQYTAVSGASRIAIVAGFSFLNSTTNNLTAPYNRDGSVITAAASLCVSTQTGNPTAGTGTVKVRVFYRIVTL